MNQQRQLDHNSDGLNPDTHECVKCGHIWRHGHSGSHDCSVLLMCEIDKLKGLCEAQDKTIEAFSKVAASPLSVPNYGNATVMTMPIVSQCDKSLRLWGDHIKKELAKADEQKSERDGGVVDEIIRLARIGLAKDNEIDDAVKVRLGEMLHACAIGLAGDQ